MSDRIEGVKKLFTAKSAYIETNRGEIYCNDLFARCRARLDVPRSQEPDNQLDFSELLSELLREVQGKTKAEKIILCGSHFANPLLFSRMQRNLKQTHPLMNIRYPIGKENAVVGGVYL